MAELIRIYSFTLWSDMKSGLKCPYSIFLGIKYWRRKKVNQVLCFSMYKIRLTIYETIEYRNSLLIFSGIPTPIFLIL